MGLWHGHNSFTLNWKDSMQRLLALHLSFTLFILSLSLCVCVVWLHVWEEKWRETLKSLVTTHRERLRMWCCSAYVRLIVPFFETMKRGCSPASQCSPSEMPRGSLFISGLGSGRARAPIDALEVGSRMSEGEGEPWLHFVFVLLSLGRGE